MAISKLDFARGQVVNPLDGIGDDLLKYSDSLKQQEQNKIANARAQEQLDLQKQQYADQQAAKAAGSKYMADLGKVLESGVVSQADQAKLAAISQNQAISPEERARQIDAMLPKMSDAYQKDTAGQLQLMRGVVAAPTMDARDKVALYGSMADPLEKKLDRTEQFANQKALQEMSDQKAIALAKLNHDYRLAEQKAETEAQLNRFDRLEKAKQDMTPMYNKAGTRVLYKDLTPEQLKSGEWFDKDTQTARLNAADKAFEQKIKSDEFEIKKTESVRKQREEVDKLVASSGNPGSTGQVVAQMRQNKMPESAIYSALSTATGGGPTDWGNPDYNVGRLEDVLSSFKTSGVTPSGTDKADQETAKEAAEEQIKSDQDRRKALLGAPELSEKEAAELETITRRLASTDKSERRAKEQQEIDRVLGLKPSQMTKKDRDILNAYKYGYIPGTNIPASADIAGVTY